VSDRLPLGARRSLDIRLVAALERVGQAARAHLWREAGRQGLTPTQAQLLLRLRTDPPQHRRVEALASHLHLTHPTVSDALSALIRKGLATRRRDGPRGRRSTLDLTPSGEEVAGRLEAWYDPFFRAVATRPTAEKERTLELLLAIIQHLHREGVITVARTCVTCRFFRPNLHPGAQPHHCDLLGVPLGTGALRVDCPEHQQVA